MHLIGVPNQKVKKITGRIIRFEKIVTPLGFKMANGVLEGIDGMIYEFCVFPSVYSNTPNVEHEILLRECELEYSFVERAVLILDGLRIF